MSSVGGQRRWRVLVTPRWLAWHAFAVVAFIGMLWLGDWQFHRALSGNGLSWAYTFEWPLFAIMGAIFWGKTVRDELWPKPGAGASGEQVRLPEGALAGEPDPIPGAGSAGAQPAAAADQAGGEDDEAEAAELAAYNAYLARLHQEARGHGRWHGLR
jgi:hypothetical protein